MTNTSRCAPAPERASDLTLVGSQTRQRRCHRLDDPDGAAGDRHGTTARHGTSTARRDGGGEDGGGQDEDTDGGEDGANGAAALVDGRSRRRHQGHRLLQESNM